MVDYSFVVGEGGATSGKTPKGSHVHNRGFNPRNKGL